MTTLTFVMCAWHLVIRLWSHWDFLSLRCCIVQFKVHKCHFVFITWKKWFTITFSTLNHPYTTFITKCGDQQYSTINTTNTAWKCFIISTPLDNIRLLRTIIKLLPISHLTKNKGLNIMITHASLENFLLNWS